MMKKLSLLLVLIIVLGAFSACDSIGSKPPADTTTEPSSDAAEPPADTTEQSDLGYERDFSFTYEMDKTEYTRGENIKIKATVTNSSGEDYTYTGSSTAFFPSVSLYWIHNGNEKGGIIEHDPIAITDDYVKMTIKPGDSGSRVYTFLVPDDAVCGEYSLQVSFSGESSVFENVLRINAVTSQNENTEYNYSPVSVSSGGESVNPIRTLTSSYVKHADGTAELGCDGLGVWNYFNKDDTDKSTFPLLVCEDDISIDIPEYTDIYSVRIFDLNYEQLGSNLTSIDEINYLPAGDYLVVLSVRYDTSVRDRNEYEKNGYEDFFRLTVLPNTSEKAEYTYSSVIVQSGNFEIRPIQCMLWVEEHKNGEVVCGDGFGVSQIIENKEDHSNFPTLVRKGSVSFLPPVNAYISDVIVYDTEYNELDYSIDLNGLQFLIPGEYLIVFREETDSRGCVADITEYTVTANECIFKFIVPENTVQSFSFSAIREIYKAGDPGVKTEGFKNTSEQAVTNSAEAVERAKCECTVEYDIVTAQYDSIEKIWSITFSTFGTLGGCQTVYLDSNGMTLLIVYGE